MTLVLFGLHGFICATVVGVLKRRGVLLVLATLFAGAMAAAPFVPTLPVEGGRALLLAMVSLLYAIGLTYSHIHQRLAGISHVEKVYWACGTRRRARRILSSSAASTRS